MNLERVNAQNRIDVGPLPPFGKLTRQTLLDSCLLSMYYVNVLTAITGKYEVHMVNENVLAFLWVVLLGIQGFGKMSDKRHTQARTFIHEAFTDADQCSQGGTPARSSLINMSRISILPRQRCVAA